MTAGKRSAGERLPKSRHPVFSLPWLLERSQINEQTGCWEWQLAKDANGYGRTKAGGGITRKNNFSRFAHREAWIYQHGAITAEMAICHCCDNPCCVNPDHLFVGTKKDNSLDMCKKLRHGRRKLSPQQIVEIKRSPDGCRVLGRRYGVTSHNIQMIRKGKTWQWLDAGCS